MYIYIYIYIHTYKFTQFFHIYTSPSASCSGRRAVSVITETLQNSTLKSNFTADPTWGDIFESSKLERLFCHVSVKRDVRALSFERWNSIRKCDPKWDWLYDGRREVSVITEPSTSHSAKSLLPHEKLLGILRVLNLATRKDLADRTWGGSVTNPKCRFCSRLLYKINKRGAQGSKARLQEAFRAVTESSTSHNVKSLLWVKTLLTRLLQPVPWKTRLEMLVGMQNEILDGHRRSLFKQLIWKESWTLTIEDFDLQFDEHFESRLLGNGLYKRNL